MADWTDVAAPRGSVRFPSICPACLARGASVGISARSDLGRLKGIFIESLSIESVPYCETCATKFRRTEKWVHAGMYLGLAVGIPVALRTRSIQDGLLVALVLWIPLGWISQLQTSVRISQFDKESVTFRFRRPEYAAEFRKANGMT